MNDKSKYVLDDKYKSKISVRNDSVTMVGNTKGVYVSDNNGGGDIRIKVGDITMEDFGFASNDKDMDLLLIHERQHEIDREEKGVGKENLSLNENYQRDYHMEIAALIAEKLEIRRQFKEIDTEEKKKAFFEKFANNEENKEYIEALKSGEINPNSIKTVDFMKEMAFIKDSSIRYRADPNDSGYKKVITGNAISYLMANGDNVKSNPVGFKKEVNAIYQIAGFDFNNVGNQNLYVMNNDNLEFADKLLESGVDANDLAKFLSKSSEVFAMDYGDFVKAEKFDLTGLSQAQAEQVLQTHFIACNQNFMLAEGEAFGRDDRNDKIEMTASMGGEEQIALYLKMKRDSWEKNGTLSEEGNEEKFQKLMEQAKTVEIDTEAWFKLMESALIVAKDPSKKEEFEALKKRVKASQGKIVNLDDYSNGYKSISVENVLEKMKKEEERSKAFWEEYYKEHPEDNKERLSESYEVEVMNLQSPMLKDELNKKKELESKVEYLCNPYQGHFDVEEKIALNTSFFNQAELRKITNENGDTLEVAIIDGKKHGAEIYRDTDGKIKSYKLYNQGEELDMSSSNIDIKQVMRDGKSFVGFWVDGKPFGAHTYEDENGNCSVLFYDNNGEIIDPGVGAKVSRNNMTVDEYKNIIITEMKQQVSELHDNAVSRSQAIRFEKKIDERESQKVEQNEKTSQVTSKINVNLKDRMQNFR